MNSDAKVMLFTTKTCPNCKVADTLLQKADIAFEKVDAEENAQLTQELGIRQAPTLVVFNGEKYETYANVSNIKKFIETP